MDGVAAQDLAKQEYRRRNDAETAVAVKKQMDENIRLKTHFNDQRFVEETADLERLRYALILYTVYYILILILILYINTNNYTNTNTGGRLRPMRPIRRPKWRQLTLEERLFLTLMLSLRWYGVRRRQWRESRMPYCWTMR
jgi:hypothetical protein